MRGILGVLVAAVLLGACSSNGDPVERSWDYERPGDGLVEGSFDYERPRGGLVEGSENYAGPQTAAVAPVSGGRTGQGLYDEELHADIQHSIQRQLDRSGIFAGVVALESPDEGNEAEVIIEPVLVGPAGYGGGVELRVRVTEKTKRRVVLDQRYAGGGQRNALKVAIGKLEDDLAELYER